MAAVLIGLTTKTTTTMKVRVAGFCFKTSPSFENLLRILAFYIGC
jgi:hypothetical protein